jgi:hypothetical protein
METKKVVVKGGGANLFKISISGGEYRVYQVRMNLFTEKLSNIGTTRSLEDALSLIRLYSGNQIDKISSW